MNDYSMELVVDFELSPVNDKIADELYTFVRDGSVDQLNSVLHDLSNRIDYLTNIRCYGDEKLSLLMVAALYGREDIIRVLFNHCEPEHQIELAGIMKLDDATIIQGMSALYCACYRGHFSVAKMLIDVGRANVNHSTIDEPYHPLLIHATRANRLDIVQFLIDNGYADINGTTSTTLAKSTAMTWAVRQGHVSIVQYLLDKGADIEYYCKKGFPSKFTTPLTVAVHDGNVDLVRILYNAGANMKAKNKDGDNVLAIAVKKEHWPIIHFLLQQSIITIDELELGLLSLMENQIMSSNRLKLYKYLYFILQQRLSTATTKVIRPPLAVYDYYQECQTLEELSLIQNDLNRIWIEVLMVLERILLPRHDPRFTKALNHYSHYLLVKHNFRKCIDLWIYCFSISKQMRCRMNLHIFVRIFCKMLTEKKKIPIKQFVDVCCLTFDSTQKDPIDSTVYNQLCFVVIAAKIFECQIVTHAEKSALRNWIRQLCQRWKMPSDQQTIVHLCISGYNYGLPHRYSTDVQPYIQFPNESALRLVLACGSNLLDVNAVESSMNNTALHLLCHDSEKYTMIDLLLNAGAHIDCVNSHGLTPLMYATSQKTKDFLKLKLNPMCLKCLCASQIVHEQLNTTVLGPSTSLLNKFIALHDCSRHTSDPK